MTGAFLSVEELAATLSQVFCLVDRVCSGIVIENCQHGPRMAFANRSSIQKLVVCTFLPQSSDWHPTCGMRIPDALEIPL